MRWIAALVLLAGCGECGAERPPGLKGSRPDGGLEDLTPEPAPEELVDMWKAAAKDLAVAPGEPAELRYAPPPCPLRYQLRAVHLNEVAPGRDPAGIEQLGELVANPAGERLTWELADIDTWLLNDGMRADRPVDKGTWAPALVRTDGASWKEDSGPTKLWSTHSTLPPLVWFFPRLPDQVVGSKTTWKIVTHSSRTAAKIEERRADDPDAAIPNLRGDTLEVELTLSEWIRVGEAPAAVLVGAWSDRVKQVEPIESERSEKWRARYVVAASGWLLHASLVAGKYQWWAASDDEYNAKNGSSELELRLVEACQGPRLARFPREE